MPSSNSSSALARRAKRCAAEPSRVSSIRSCRDSLSRKPGRIIRSAESRSHALASDSFGFPQSRGIPLDQIEIHVVGWLESCAPESCSERQLEELDRLIEPWLDDYERTSRDAKK